MYRTLSIAELNTAYSKGQTTPSEVIDGVLKAALEFDDEKTWIYRVPDEELHERARALVDKHSKDLPLYGIPFAVKDNIDVAGLPTTAGCPGFSYTPEKSASVVELLIEAGAILIGKTNLDQFATGLVGTRSPFGVPRNPVAPDYIPGGSSSGSAVAVSAGMVSFSLGTDTAGSGRIPAGFNNIVGLKPTKGLLSIDGVVPACRTLDCVSIFALTASDAELVRNLLAVCNHDDRLSRPIQSANLFDVRAGLSNLRLAVPNADALTFFEDYGYQRAFQRSCEQIVDEGAELVEIDFTPFVEVANLLYDGPWVTERYVGLKDFLSVNPTSLHEITRKIILGRKPFSAEDLFEASYRLADLSNVCSELLKGCDALLVPTSGTIYKVEEVEADPIELNTRLGYYTNFVNLLNMAAIAVPAGFTEDGRPFGITLISEAYTDAFLSGLGSSIHNALGTTIGASGIAVSYEAHAPENMCDSDEIILAVCGAHMRGLPLNHQLVEIGATFIREDSTAETYKLIHLDRMEPTRPGLVKCAPNDEGASIDIELWAVPAVTIGRLMQKIDAPLCIGSIELVSGECVNGFLCESTAIYDATDITAFGGWRKFLSSF